MNEGRLDVIKALIELSCPLDVIGSRIREFDWDYEGIPVELSRVHLASVLRRYLNKDLSAGDVEQWANLLEGREDVCFESGSEEQLHEVLYQLANPYLTAPLSEIHAKALVESLYKKTPD